MVKWKQGHDGFPNYGMDVSNPDFARYAESYGARGHRPGSTAELLPMLREALERPGVDVIEVPIDYGDDDRILNEEIPSLSAALGRT